MALKRFYAEEKKMKSKSFGAGVLGVLLFFAGQGIPAAAETLPEPDPVQEDSVFPGPVREDLILPPPEWDSLIFLDPNQEASILPPPEWDRLILSDPNPAASSAEARPSQQTTAGGQQAAPPAAKTGGGQKAPAPAGGKAAPQGAPAPAGGKTAPQGAPTPAAPRPPAGPSRWKMADQGLFLGAMAGMRSPSFDTDDTDWENVDIEGDSSFSGGFFVGIDFGRVIAQAEFAFNEDAGVIENRMGFEKGIGKSLMIPLIVKGDFHLGPVVLQPLAGVYFNVTLGDLELEGSMGGTEPYAYPPAGMLFGGDVGIGFGRNLIFLDFRYAMDLGKTAVGNDPISVWRRSAFVFNVGYQFFIWRKS
jgi:hypothetical protein